MKLLFLVTEISTWNHHTKKSATLKRLELRQTPAITWLRKRTVTLFFFPLCAEHKHNLWWFQQSFPADISARERERERTNCVTCQYLCLSRIFFVRLFEIAAFWLVSHFCTRHCQCVDSRHIITLYQHQSGISILLFRRISLCIADLRELAKIVRILIRLLLGNLNQNTLHFKTAIEHHVSMWQRRSKSFWFNFSSFISWLNGSLWCHQRRCCLLTHSRMSDGEWGKIRRKFSPNKQGRWENLHC